MNTARLRLLQMQDQNDAIGETMKAESERFAKIKGAEPTRAVSAFNLFQTPGHLAERMAAMAINHAGDNARWLEPSAGLGRIYRAARRGGMVGPCVLVEQSAECSRELYEATEPDPAARLIVDDFLSCDADRLGGKFDAVLMNPPFKMGRDVKHIRHAHSMLKPGGVLIGLCFDGARQNAKLRPLVDQWEPLPAGTFKAEGTSAAVSLILWTAG